MSTNAFLLYIVTLAISAASLPSPFSLGKSPFLGAPFLARPGPARSRKISQNPSKSCRFAQIFLDPTDPLQIFADFLPALSARGDRPAGVRYTPAGYPRYFCSELCSEPAGPIFPRFITLSECTVQDLQILEETMGNP